MCLRAVIISSSLREKQLLIEQSEGRAELMASRTAAPPAGHTCFCIAVSEGTTAWGPLLVVADPTPASPSAHTKGVMDTWTQDADGLLDVQQTVSGARPPATIGMWFHCSE